MRSSIQLLALGAALAIGAANTTSALAVDKDQVIKDRQALMKEQGADMGSIKGYLDGKADIAKATAGASDLIETMKKIPDVFPPGTEGPNPEGKFAPKPEVWSDWKGFLAVRDTAADKAGALLAAVKGGDKEKIQTAFGDLGKNGCGGCHGKFREEIKK
ncbi:MAG TPA: cytochrome c [Stellaceae bacterium]|nr:cytochrome c [Stellaceae bacterium]